MLVQRIFVPQWISIDRMDGWPFTVPCVRQIADKGLEFTAPVTMIVGENGSGKSTIVEAVAESFGVDSRGGKVGRRYTNDNDQTAFGKVLAVDCTPAGHRMRRGPRLKKKGFFLRAETAVSLIENLHGKPGYWEADTSAMSHGEGFLALFEEMFREPGLYIMDEPEAALSFTSCLQLVALMHELGRSGSQIVCATHSPILASTPGADIVEVGDFGYRRTDWASLDLVDHWRRYLNKPEAYLRHLTDEAENHG
ncbi:AAA family ATPase [Stackebrandtia soli]|uniref:AAA family ATPase n=1 Tax=Stackebrandtia soli TaxID=1892856 RepID=UPI0039ED4675